MNESKNVRFLSFRCAPATFIIQKRTTQSECQRPTWSEMYGIYVHARTAFGPHCNNNFQASPLLKVLQTIVNNIFKVFNRKIRRTKK